ncbi:cytosolic phospholipase A2 gamma-like [Gadus morhua]|uniref:Cytosolic phospholipase A2 gamma-like n=1 Tax=Gadus morhua TaxID=8049 RepID=A0A8C5ABA0_GADMO|nr:cytosolic phospholipase A2 gamma-like [Gadus morhua]
MPYNGWRTGWVTAAYVCVFTLITQTLFLPVEAGGATGSQPQEPASLLSLGEQQFVSERKEGIRNSLQSLGMHINADSVPHIALLGSGGGQRAAVALLGSLQQMGQDDLLDTLLYMGGVSGSGWAMASLYTDPQWSTNTAAALARLTQPGPEVDDIMAWLKVRSEQEDFSLSDLWGSLLSSSIMKQMDRTRLSDEAKRQTTNPYPVYSALEQKCYLDGQTKGKWFELTPHESGFTELNHFTPTSLLGQRPSDSGASEGEKGVEGGKEEVMEVMGVEEEVMEVMEVEVSGMDMVTLQGIIGSAMADEQKMLAHLPDWLKNILDIHSSPSEGAVDSQERKTKVDAWMEKVLKPMREGLLALPDGPVKDVVSWVVLKLLPLITEWKWGTTANFIYHSPDEFIPECLRSTENLQLVDAGLFLNSPYPPFLGARRDVDLIISLDFSLGQSLESLTLARDYAVEVGKPFPVIDDTVLEEMDWPRDFYVFPGGRSAPTIVYMPLFNQRNCRDAAEVKSKMAEYTTVQMPYNQKKIAGLLKIAMDNMKNNKNKLMLEMHSAAVRKQERRS